MKKKIVLLISFCLIIGGVALIGVNYYNNQHYAKSLISSINDDDYEQVKTLLDSSNGNVNSVHIWNTMWQKVVKEKPILTPLQVACERGNYDIIKLLLENGADANKIHSTEDSPLEITCKMGNEKRLEIVRLLVDYGATLTSDKRNMFVNYKHQKYQSYVMLIVVETDYEDTISLIEYFESRGEQIDKMYSQGSLLHYACHVGNSSVIKYLVSERGLDINANNQNGATPLIVYTYPSKHKGIEGLNFLLENGADKSVRDNAGMTAYDRAIKNGDTEFAELLKP
jgi:ankyrin repeat protein